jgi:radical SAM protein with 4Fe4S-binding SPASM domain
MLADKGWGITLITNLTKLPEDINFLKKVDRIQVSIDGLPEDHDRQRGKGTFATTYRNLRRLFKAGLGNSIIVQACLPNDYNEEKRRHFLEAIVYAGAAPERISLGGMTTGYDDRDIPRDKLPVEYTYLSHKPCCEYQVMSNFTVTPDGNVFASYHGVGRSSHRLGTIEDSPETIRERFRNMAERLVWANDPKCLECPALKRCWGMFCYQIFKYGNTPKPSDYCQQERMIELNAEWIKKHGDDITKGIPTGEDREFCS